MKVRCINIRMKNGLILFIPILIILINSCIKKDIGFYDVDSPQFEFYTFIKDYVIFQFSEPLSFIKLYFNNRPKEIFSLENKFPVANIPVPTSWFDNKNEKLQIEASDTKGNKLITEINSPINNINPAIVKIEEVRIKYSNKLKQKINLKALSNGNTDGYRLILFIDGKKVVIPFLPEKVNSHNFLELLIDKSRDKLEKAYTIGFSKKRVELNFSSRLSQTCSLILIINHKDEILDHLFYYNSQEHSLDYYKGNRNFKRFNAEVLDYDVTPDWVDVKGTTTKKTIKRLNKKFGINKY